MYKGENHFDVKGKNENVHALNEQFSHKKDQLQSREQYLLIRDKEEHE